MISLKTGRLLIRDHVQDDLEDLYSLIGNRKAMTYIMDLFAHHLTEAQENLSVAIQAQNMISRDKYFFAIIEIASGHYIGEIGFTVMSSASEGQACDDNNTCAYTKNSLVELGYFIQPEFWNKGYVTEAVKCLIAFAFDELDVHKIMTGCVRENGASEAVMRKAGFHHEGTLNAHQLVNGQWKDRVLYGMTREQYEAYKDSR